MSEGSKREYLAYWVPKMQMLYTTICNLSVVASSLVLFTVFLFPTMRHKKIFMYIIIWTSRDRVFKIHFSIEFGKEHRSLTHTCSTCSLLLPKSWGLRKRLKSLLVHRDGKKRARQEKFLWKGTSKTCQATHLGFLGLAAAYKIDNVCQWWSSGNARKNCSAALCYCMFTVCFC